MILHFAIIPTMPTIATKIQTHLVSIVAFVAIMKIAETNNEETCQAIRRVCIDASNFFEHNFSEQEKEDEH